METTNMNNPIDSVNSDKVDKLKEKCKWACTKPEKIQKKEGKKNIRTKKRTRKC